jgi:hypothetical protein
MITYVDIYNQGILSRRAISLSSFCRHTDFLPDISIPARTKEVLLNCHINYQTQIKQIQSIITLGAWGTNIK